MGKLDYYEVHRHGTNFNVTRAGYKRTYQTAQLFGRLSKQEIVSTGVQQESILGPMLFSCYINDICSVCKISKMLLCADDTFMYREISDKERCLDMHNFKYPIYTH